MRFARSFGRDENGGTLITFAFCLVPLLAFIGVAIDYASAVSQRTLMQGAADAAVLAGAKNLRDNSNTEAIQQAQLFLKAKLAAAGLNYNATVTATTDSVTASVSAPHVNALGAFIGKKVSDVGVKATAVALKKPSDVKFTPGRMQGGYYKRISIVVVPKGQTAEKIVASISYQPTYFFANDWGDYGKGTASFDPPLPGSGYYSLGEYTKLYLRMDIKYDGCAPNYYNRKPLKEPDCAPTDAASSKMFDDSLRTDDPARVDHLFVDGKQLPKGVIPPETTILPCTGTHQHAWEDGGDWKAQDMLYTVEAKCNAVDTNAIRLTQ